MQSIIRFVSEFKKPTDILTGEEPIKLSLTDSKRYQTRDYRNKLYKEILVKIGTEQPVPMEKVPFTR